MEEKGVFQQKNGLWAYRISLKINDELICQRKTVDENGEKLKTKSQAIKARQRAIEKAIEEANQKVKIERRKVKDVYEEYCRLGREGKAYATKKKQDCLWNIHLKKEFGDKYVDTLTIANINDYLERLYYVDGYAYKYVESFLKWFYLLFGQAYSRNYLDYDTYNKMCLNKTTKIKMPKLKVDEDLDIVIFTRKEIKKLDKYFSGTNAETAYYLGRYCGLRINECYGLKWENVDFENSAIRIDRQMQYQEGLIKLVPVKTRCGKRTVIIPATINDYLFQEYQKRQRIKSENPRLIEQNHKLIEDIDGTIISSYDLVNSCENGIIQTKNSMKYHSRLITEKLNITFRYHYLRHTYGTMMADLNTPEHLLCSQMGHSNINITHQYYISVSEDGINQLKKNLKKL